MPTFTTKPLPAPPGSFGAGSLPATAANRPPGYYPPEGIDPDTLQARYNPNAPTNPPPGGIFGSAAPPGMQSSSTPPPLPAGYYGTPPTGMQFSTTPPPLPLTYYGSPPGVPAGQPTGGIMSGQPGQPNYQWLAHLLMGMRQRQGY